MYPIQSRDSSTEPGAALRRARLRWHSSGRRPAGPGNYPGGLPRQGRIAGSRFWSSGALYHRPGRSVPPVLMVGWGLSAIWVLHPTPAQPARKPVSACSSGWPESRSGGSGCHESHRALFHALGRPQCIKQDATLFPPSAYFFREKCTKQDLILL